MKKHSKLNCTDLTIFIHKKIQEAQRDRETDGFMIANTALCIAYYADVL